MVVWAIDRLRSAIISTRSRKLSLKRRYHLTHSTMISRSKWRPSNSSSKLRNPAISPPQPITALRDREAAELHQSHLGHVAPVLVSDNPILALHPVGPSTQQLAL